MTPTESPTAAFIRMARDLKHEHESYFTGAARAIARQDPALTLEVMETIGRLKKMVFLNLKWISKWRFIWLILQSNLRIVAPLD